MTRGPTPRASADEADQGRAWEYARMIADRHPAIWPHTISDATRNLALAFLERLDCHGTGRAEDENG